MGDLLRVEVGVALQELGIIQGNDVSVLRCVQSECSTAEAFRGHDSSSLISRTSNSMRNC